LVIGAKVEALKAEAREELERIDAMGGAVAAVESSYMKQRLVESNAARIRAIESGEQIVVGVNRWTETEPSPLSAGEDSGILTVPESVEREQVEQVKAWRAARDAAAAAAAIAELRSAAQEGRNLMEPSIACAKSGVTTGEWGETLREVFGEYRAPTGVGKVRADSGEGIAAVRAEVERVSARLGRRIKFLVGKPGLDGHSNGAEQIAVRARDCGMEVVYEGIRLTPAEIVNAALEEGVHVVGLSILSGSHVPLVREVMERMRAAGLEHVPVAVGGIIPEEDEAALKAAGVAAVYTPKDFQLNAIMAGIVRLIDPGARAA
jgi:ethylmalonyl-CoA mutase